MATQQENHRETTQDVVALAVERIGTAFTELITGFGELGGRGFRTAAVRRPDIPDPTPDRLPPASGLALGLIRGEPVDTSFARPPRNPIASAAI